MSEKTSVLLSDVTIKGDIIEKERLVIDAKIDGDVTADKLQTHSGSKINGNISSTDASLGGRHATAVVEGAWRSPNRPTGSMLDLIEQHALTVTVL